LQPDLHAVLAEHTLFQVGLKGPKVDDAARMTRRVHALTSRIIITIKEIPGSLVASITVFLLLLARDVDLISS
jgi:hypothetical protein